MKDYRSLEQKIRSMYEVNGTTERRKIENVGRPDDEKPTSEKSKLAKQGEIKTKIIDEEEELAEKVPDNWEENSEKKRAATVKANVNKVNSRQGAVLMPHDKIHEAMKQDTPAKQDGNMDAMDAKLIKGGKTEVILDPKTDDRAEDTSTEDKTGQKALRAANKTIGQKGSGKLKEMFSAAELNHIMSILEAERKEPNFASAKKDAFAEPSSSSPSSFLSPMPGMGSQAGSKGNLGSAGRPAGVGGGKSGIKVEPTFGPGAPRLGGADSGVRVPTPKPSGDVSLGQAVKATGAVLGTTAAAKLGMDALNNRSSGGAAPDTSAKDTSSDTPKNTTKADEPVSKSVSTRTGDSGSTTVYQTPKKTNNESINLRGNIMSSERTIFGIPTSVINEISDFGKAFKSAREKAGGAGGEFEFGGKKFNTNIKGEPYKSSSAPKPTPTPPPVAAEPAKPIKAPDAIRNDSPLSSDRSSDGSSPLSNMKPIPGSTTYKSDTLSTPKPSDDAPKPKFTNRAEETDMTDPIIENAMRALTMMARGRKDSGILEASSSDPDFGAPRPGGEKKPGDIQFKPGPDSNNRGPAVTKEPEKSVPLPPKRPAGLGEALKGGQKKIDKNHNGKLDADDFKKLRKEEVEGLDELSKDTLGRYAAKAHSKGDMAARMSNHGKNKDMADYANKRYQGVQTAIKKLREEEALDELSKKTLGSYIKNATSDAATNAHTAGLMAGRSETKNSGKTFLDKAIQRKKGINMAADKLTREEVGFSEAEIARIEEIAKDL